MVISSRDIVKFLLFVVLIGAVVFYVAGHGEGLLENLPFFASGEDPPGEEAAERPTGSPGESPDSGEPAGGGGTGSPEDAASEETVPVFSFSPDSFEADFFADFRLERERARSLQLDLLQEILDDPDLGGEAHAQAMDLWLEITSSVSMEADIEGLILAKGFGDAVVVLSSGKATILVKADSLTEEEVVCIADIAVRVAGLSYEDITVMPREG